MKDVQCYELLGAIALKNHAFSFHFISIYLLSVYVFIYIVNVTLTSLSLSYFFIYIYMCTGGKCEFTFTFRIHRQYTIEEGHRSVRKLWSFYWIKVSQVSFIVASFNAQSVTGNDMACKRCEISTFIADNGVDLFFVTETWLSAQGDEAKTV